ncbi:MAG: single-stranded-DNA-specific exonuclease RecJ, partial [Chromatiaceae bacterium]
MTPVRIRRAADGWAAADPPRSPGELLERLHARRGESAGGRALALAGLAPYGSLAGIDAAVEVLTGAIRAGRSILVVGDYDADGATGSALAVLGLRALG